MWNMFDCSMFGVSPSLLTPEHWPSYQVTQLSHPPPSLCPPLPLPPVLIVLWRAQLSPHRKKLVKKRTERDDLLVSIVSGLILEIEEFHLVMSTVTH